MDQSQAFTDLDLPLDNWHIQPSRLATFYYSVLYLLVMLLISLLVYYQQRGLIELLLAFSLVVLIAAKDREVILQSRRTLLLRYGSSGWILSEKQANCENGLLKFVARSARVRVLVRSPLCLVVEGDRANKTPLYSLEREIGQNVQLSRLLVWRDQLSYDAWRTLQSRIAAQ